MADEKLKFSSEEELIDHYCAMPHPKAASPAILLVIALTALLGAIIGMELIVRFGLSANSSIIGALIAVLIGMFPFASTKKFRNIHVQNLVETSISCATFGAGNVLMVCVAVIWVFDQPQLCTGMLIGGIIAFLVDITMMYWLFDTPLFPAKETWPIGIATAETILAAAEMGKKALTMLVGIVVGVAGSWVGLPMDIIGICGLGNIAALTAFCIALTLNGYWKTWFGYTLGSYYVPQGLMVGAGIVGMVQAFVMIRKKYGEKKDSMPAAEQPEPQDDVECTRSTAHMSKSVVKGFVLYIVGAVIMAVIAGFASEMSMGKLVWWVIYAALAALISELLVGISAMHSGYFPAMAMVLIFLVFGLFMGFPATALAYLAGFAACTGPAFADMGYDLKTGWILRGRGKNPAYELEGRRQQYVAEIFGAIVTVIAVFICYRVYFTSGRIPPVATVYKATIEAGVNSSVLRNILIWAVVGGAMQAVFGIKRQIGIMFAAGMLITSPAAGVAGLIFLAIRIAIQKMGGDKATQMLNVFSAGLIAGSAIYSFFKNTLGLFVTKNKAA